MTVAEAKKILSRKLKFGNQDQIRARLFVDAVEEIKQLIITKANEHHQEKFEDFEIARAVLKEFDEDA